MDDLKTLWEVGVETYDDHEQELFTLKAILLWTTDDFPAYGNLSGCATKGFYVFPICGEETNSQRLKHGIRTHIPVISDFFHATIHLENKKRHLMVNESLGYLKKNLLEMKYLEMLIPFVPHGERRRLNDVGPLLLIQVVGRRGLYS